MSFDLLIVKDLRQKIWYLTACMHCCLESDSDKIKPFRSQFIYFKWITAHKQFHALLLLKMYPTARQLGTVTGRKSFTLLKCFELSCFIKQFLLYLTLEAAGIVRKVVVEV